MSKLYSCVQGNGCLLADNGNGTYNSNSCNIYCSYTPALTPAPTPVSPPPPAPPTPSGVIIP